MTTPHVVFITERPQPKFKKHPHKSIQVDPLGAFSSVLNGVLHVEDIRVYIHANIDEFGDSRYVDFFEKQLMDENKELKPEYKAL